MKLSYLFLAIIFIFGMGFASYKIAYAKFASSVSNNGNSFTAAASFPTASVSLKINEFLVHPSEGNSEWVEIFNNGSTSVDLSGWKIIDGNGINDDISLTGTVSPNSFAIFNHATGWLNDTGDTVSLLNPSAQVMDTEIFSSSLVGIDISTGRNPDGTGAFKKCATVTKGTSNIGC